jgi:hypothetical protein
MGQSSSRLTAVATGRTASDALGRNLKPIAVDLVIEFVTEAGQVVASQEVAVPALEPATTHEIKAEGRGTGIAGWRYRRK